MKLSSLIEGLNVIDIFGDSCQEISSVCYSADKCEEGALFVAITGLKHDGHNYITQAIDRGARCVVHEKNIKTSSEVTAIKVTNSRRALGILAKNYFRDPSAQLCLIGVTGTNGKTTTTYFLESILTREGCKCGVLGTVNYRYNNKIFPAPNTTPESYEMQKILRTMVDEGITHVIAEVSSHALDLKRIDDCDFDLGIFTNLSHEHLDYHLTMEIIFRPRNDFLQKYYLKAKSLPAERL